MSYVVSIVRDEKAKAPLALADIEALVSQDASLQYDPEDEILVWTGHPSGEKIGFCFVSGRLESMTTPDRKTERKMEEVARSLGALLEGEDRVRLAASGPLRTVFRKMVGLVVPGLVLGLGLMYLLRKIRPQPGFGGLRGHFIAAGLLVLAGAAVLGSAWFEWSDAARKLGAVQRLGDFFRAEVRSLAFAVGFAIMAIAIVIRGLLNQRGSLAGVVLWLFLGGVAILFLGEAYDFIRNRRG
jgi:hypothetical protein